MRISRRALMVGAGAAALGAAAPLHRSFADSEIKEFRLAAKLAVVNLTGEGHRDTTVWAYDGTVPGTELRIRQGDPLRIVVNNKLGEDTTVHWHGIRLPNPMDGGWVRPGTPSIGFGKRMPCQWTVVSSPSLLLTTTRMRSPWRTRTSGPGTVPS